MQVSSFKFKNVFSLISLFKTNQDKNNLSIHSFVACVRSFVRSLIKLNPSHTLHYTSNDFSKTKHTQKKKGAQVPSFIQGNMYIDAFEIQKKKRKQSSCSDRKKGGKRKEKY